MDIVFTVYDSHVSVGRVAAVKALVYITVNHLQFFFSLFLLLSFKKHVGVYLYLQEVDAAGARRWGDPDKAEAGGGLVADV